MQKYPGLGITPPDAKLIHEEGLCPAVLRGSLLDSKQKGGLFKFLRSLPEPVRALPGTFLAGATWLATGDLTTANMVSNEVYQSSGRIIDSLSYLYGIDLGSIEEI